MDRRFKHHSDLPLLPRRIYGFILLRKLLATHASMLTDRVSPLATSSRSILLPCTTSPRLFTHSLPPAPPGTFLVRLLFEGGRKGMISWKNSPFWATLDAPASHAFTWKIGRKKVRTALHTSSPLSHNQPPPLSSPRLRCLMHPSPGGGVHEPGRRRQGAHASLCHALARPPDPAPSTRSSPRSSASIRAPSSCPTRATSCS